MKERPTKVDPEIEWFQTSLNHYIKQYFEGKPKHSHRVLVGSLYT